ncbi:MAG: hypothetical protein RIE59_23720 [Imperialibacter sp.]
MLAIFSKYVHIFWIPFFPYKKSASIVCTHCNLTTEEKELPADKKSIVSQLKSTVSIPKYHFTGLAIIVVAVAYFSFMDWQNEQQQQAYLESPLAGDVYILKDSEEVSQYNHYLMKVAEITNDSLWVSVSSFSYDGVIDALDVADGFYDIVFPVHKNDLNSGVGFGEIRKVFRDYSSSTGFDRVIEYVEPDSLGVE